MNWNKKQYETKLTLRRKWVDALCEQHSDKEVLEKLKSKITEISGSIQNPDIQMEQYIIIIFALSFMVKTKSRSKDLLRRQSR